MGSITGAACVLPVVVFAAWLASWWWRRWIRWVLVSGGAFVSVLVIVIPTLIIGSQPAAPFVRTPTCDSPMCWNSGRADPLAWWSSGLVGIAFCVALAVMTALIEIVLDANRGTTV